MCDNPVFNVNGRSLGMLERAIALACEQHSGADETTPLDLRPGKPGARKMESEIAAWAEGRGGLYFCCLPCKKSPPFSAPITTTQAAFMAWAWLQRPHPEIEFKGWDANADHDGDNVAGWRVYRGQWGLFPEDEDGKEPYPDFFIMAIRPVYLWLGK